MAAEGVREAAGSEGGGRWWCRWRRVAAATLEHSFLSAHPLPQLRVQLARRRVLRSSNSNKGQTQSSPRA